MKMPRHTKALFFIAFVIVQLASSTAGNTVLPQKMNLSEGYSLILLQIDPDGDLATLELQKNGTMIDRGTFESGHELVLRNKSTIIIKGMIDSTFGGMDIDLVELTQVSQYSENGSILKADMKIILGYKSNRNIAYWELDNGYTLIVRNAKPYTGKALFSLMKNGIIINSTDVTTGSSFSLVNDTGVRIISGTVESIYKKKIMYWCT